LPIEVPPLRQRVEDIPVLVDTFLEEFAVLNRSKRKEITPAALAVLNKYAWPGNVRELKNLVERLAIMVETDAIGSEDVPDAYNLDACPEPDLAGAQFFQVDDLKEAKQAFEKEFISLKLAQHHNNVTKTAESIGVGRSYLHKKIKNFK
jgi:two-component system nitrogen regulation response regulator NtrX